METLIAYKGDAKLKKLLVAEVKRHEKADQIIAGTYGKENGKWRGCAVGCSIHSLNIKLKKTLPTNDHTVYESELGVSQTLARLEDTLFEGMWRGNEADAIAFPAKFAQAIPVGADLSLVPAKFMIFCVNDTLKNFDNEKFPDVVKAVKQVTQLWQDVIDGKFKNKEEQESAAWSAARSAAWSAESAASAARSAAWSAESAARSAAWSAESAAWSAASAAWSAESAASAASAARSAAWSAESAASAAYKRYGNHLLKLLKEAPQAK